MMHPVPFHPNHFRALLPQPAQGEQAARVTDDALAGMVGSDSHTLMDDETPIACCGAAPLWPGRAYVWSFVGRVPPARFREVHSWALRFLDGLPYRRLEAAVELDFAAGHRWMELLGFTRECPCAKAFTHDGADCALYARVRP